MTRRSREHPDDLRSPSGRALYRTWVYSGSADGEDYRYGELGDGVIRVRETHNYAPGPTDDRESADERVAREGRYASAVAALNDVERSVLEHQGKLMRRVEFRLTIPAGELVEYQRDGYTLIPGSVTSTEAGEVPALDLVEVVGTEWVQVAQLDHDGVAERLGITVRQVRSAVTSANRKLRGRK